MSLSRTQITHQYILPLVTGFLLLSGCGSVASNQSSETSNENEDALLIVSEDELLETEEANMNLYIGDTKVPVTWQENKSMEELKESLPLTIQMSMYGGFEQVGPIGKQINSNDEWITTDSGDIVLYASNQIVIFYGSNSWDYTRLGHVNLVQEELTDLLSNGDVTITISLD